MKAVLKTYRQSPRKVRIVADLIRGKKVFDARNALSFTPKRASSVLIKLLDSAVANALQKGEDKDALFVKAVQVNKGVTMKRIMPRARGSASRINKRTSHVEIVLGVKEVKAISAPKKEAKAVKPKKATVKKVTKTKKDAEEAK